MNSTAAASLTCPSPAITGELGHRERQHRPKPLAAGRDEVVCHLGIIVTSDPVRDKIVVLTRCMSSATRSTSRSMDGAAGLSNGTTTAKRRISGEESGSIEMGSATGKSTGKPTGEKRCRAENGHRSAFSGRRN